MFITSPLIRSAWIVRLTRARRRREKSRSERAGGILAQQRQAPKRGPDLGHRHHVFELPANLVADRPG
jgi:hypothetical protein